MVTCDISNWIRVNNNAIAYFGGITQTVTPDNCKVAVTENKDWINPSVNNDFQACAAHNGTVILPTKVMNAFGVEIVTMLDDFKLPLAAIRWKEVLRGPELENLSAQQLLREVLEPQYIESMNKSYESKFYFWMTLRLVGTQRKKLKFCTI